MKQNKITKSARGEQCQVRWSGICNWNPQTVVLAHLPDGSGSGKMGGKSNDLCSVYACSDCHDAIDGRRHVEDKKLFMLAVYEGHMRTLRLIQEKGLI